MSTINVLFYSNRCQGSKHLIALLDAENLTNYFHLICTDNNPKIPAAIKVTPTLIVRGINTPYVANDAFVWLTKMKQWKANKISLAAHHPSSLPKKEIKIPNETTSVEAFSEIEMNRRSDLFSFFSKNIKTECKNPLPQAFFPITAMGKETFPIPKQSSNRSLVDNQPIVRSNLRAHYPQNKTLTTN